MSCVVKAGCQVDQQESAGGSFKNIKTRTLLGPTGGIPLGPYDGPQEGGGFWDSR